MKLKTLTLMTGLVLAHAALALPAALPPAGVEYVVLQATPDSGPTKGQLRVEWAQTSKGSGHLRVFATGRTAPIQVLANDAMLEPDQLALALTDFNGDGYADLVFTNIEGMFRATHDSDVYLWVPKLQRFVKSETLSQVGEYSPGRAPNCVAVSSACAFNGYNERELCFNQAAGRWHTVADSGCRSAE